MPEITITEKALPSAIHHEEKTIELPEIAWRGSFADYRELVAETTEAADAFHFATWLQVEGCTIGRKLYVYHAGRLYPNFYVCLVGRSGLTRKDTTWSRGAALLERLHAYPELEGMPPFRIVKGIRSYEGLLDELSGKRKVRLIQVGELLSLLSKARQDSLSNIIPALTELYDCPPYVNPPVHQKAVIPCEEPFVSIMAGTTQSWLQKALTERDIYGGFANRWLYFLGLPKAPMPNPPKVDDKKRTELVTYLNHVRNWADDVPGGEITVSDQANATFAQYYHDYYGRCQVEGLIPTLIVRVQDAIWKLALLYAADEMSKVITCDHLDAAIAVGDYLEASVTKVFASFGASAGKVEENRVLESLLAKGGPVLNRDLYRSLSMSAKEFEGVIQPLVKLGLVKNTNSRAPNGRPLTYYEAVTGP